MGQTSKMGMGRIVKKRDKAFDKIEFNREYPAVAAALADAKNEKKRRQLELQTRKKLYPLEVAAAPSKEGNREQRDVAIAALVQKQTMPRRAIEQTALRKEKKAGKQAADEYRKQKLGKLDKQLEDLKSNLLQRYPDVDQPAQPAAVAAYEAAQKEAAEALAAFDAKCEADKKEALEKLDKKLAAQNEKHKQRFDEANAQLRAMSSAEAKEVPGDTVLSIQGMKMYFSGIKAVDDLSFDIKTGEIFGLIGPNGAGKSTLFNCITQFYKPTSGQVYYRDRFDNVINLVDYKAHDVVKTGITRTFQNLELVLSLSVLDNLLVGAHTYYHTNQFDQFVHTKRLKDEEGVNRAQALEVLERMDLLQYKDHFPQGLPYGVLKKIELARTLMTKPRLIILDEPAAGLNEVETEELAGIIRQIRDDFGCTIFLVEHDMNLVMSVCDTICAISFGKKLAIGNPKEIQASPLVQEAYLGAAEEGA